MSPDEGDWWSPFILLLLLVIAQASESPDRECCKPIYPFIDKDKGLNEHTERPIHQTIGFGHPEEPPEILIGCATAKKLCSENYLCSQVLRLIPQLCGLELVTCSTNTAPKCQAALRTIRGFNFFTPTCLCKRSMQDPECNQFLTLIYDHPCLSKRINDNVNAKTNALPYCSHSLTLCQRDIKCQRAVTSFEDKCRQNGKSCLVQDKSGCKAAWTKLRQFSLFGCICPKTNQKTNKCQEIFRRINENPCIDSLFFKIYHSNKLEAFWHRWYGNNYELISSTTSTTTTTSTKRVTKTYTVPYSMWTKNQQSVDESKVTTINMQYKTTGQDSTTSLAVNSISPLKSTCHLALQDCERTINCRKYLEHVKRSCESKSCDKFKCMQAVEDMYKNIPNDSGLDIAFCLCKNTPIPDELCMRAQKILHPVCEQQNKKLPACHHVAKGCRKDSKCRYTAAPLSPASQCVLGRSLMYGNHILKDRRCNNSKGI